MSVYFFGRLLYDISVNEIPLSNALRKVTTSKAQTGIVEPEFPVRCVQAFFSMISCGARFFQMESAGTTPRTMETG